MECSCYKLLTCAALTLDEYAHIRLSHLIGELFNLLHLGTVVNKIALELIHPELLLQARYLREQLPLFQRLDDGEIELLFLERLNQIIGGARFHSLYDNGGLSQCAEHEDRKVLGYLPDFAECLQPVHIR